MRGWLVGWGLVACTSEPLVAFEDAALDVYEVNDVADTEAFLALSSSGLERPIMVNFLRYRDQAVGDGFEGMTGEEAYTQYAQGIVDLQGDLGTRTVWNGTVDAHVVGSSDPVFETAALVEYDSVSAFLDLTQSIPAEASASRSAGLLGQWLIAAATESEGTADVGTGDACGSWTAEDAAEATGLSVDQAQRLLDGPDGPVGLVELIRVGDATGDFDAYHTALSEAAADLGAVQRWEGALVSQLLGRGAPAFERLVATDYPSRDCVVTALAEPEVTDQGSARQDGAEVYWIHAVQPADGLF